MIKLLIIYVLTHVNYVVFQIVRLFRGLVVWIVSEILGVMLVFTGLRKPLETLSLFVLH